MNAQLPHRALARHALWLLAVMALSCGGAEQKKTMDALDIQAVDHDARTAHAEGPSSTSVVGATPRSESRPLEIVEGTLPEPPPGTLWGDGWGLTQHEAVLNARRVISEQVVSRVSSETRSFRAKANGVSENSVSIRIKATSSFEHGELIRAIGVKRENGGFVVRAILDRREAAEVYRDEISRHLTRLEELGPVLRTAIAGRDSAILLSTKWSPAHILAEVARKTQVVHVLGGQVQHRPTAEQNALAKAATEARSRTIIRLRVEGQVSPALRSAVVGEVSELLEARGCRFADSRVRGDADSMLVDARLSIVKRDHQEQGVLWRYVGLGLTLTDAQSGAPVFAYAGLPEIVHGGGASWPQADQAVARRLDEKLEEKAAQTFLRLTCR